MAAATVATLITRDYYLRKLFPGFHLARHTIRSVLPSVIPIAAVLALRLVDPGDGSTGRFFAELALYVVLTVAATAFFERRLLREATGYLRAATRRAPQPSAGAPA